MPRTTRTKPKKRFPIDELVPTGSTLLNLCMSEQSEGGKLKGKIFNLIGDSHAGKTFVALTIAAEISNSKYFQNYNVVYDDVERANSFDMEPLFGEENSKKIMPPSINSDGNPIFSETFEDWMGYLEDWSDMDDPFIYILDSMDALDTKADKKKREETIDANRKEKESKGSFGMAKAKLNSEYLKSVGSICARNGSIVIVVSQTRTDIDPYTMTKKTRAGGKALKFYSSFEMWMGISKKLKKGDMDIGVISKIKVTKNKVTGKVREIPIRLYYDYGMDDVRTNIEWLLTVPKFSEWIKPKKAQKFVAPDFGFDDQKLNSTTIDNLIKHIEDNDLEKDLSKVVERVWLEIEETTKVNKLRKKKYL